MALDIGCPVPGLSSSTSCSYSLSLSWSSSPDNHKDHDHDTEVDGRLTAYGGFNLPNRKPRPEKNYVMKQPSNTKKTDQHDGATRRSFLSRLWVGLGLVVLAEIFWLVLSFLKPARPKATPGEYGSVIDCGRVDAFPPGSVVAFPRGRFYLCRFQDGGFMALSRQCTHLGCTLPWDETAQMFRCPCHGSTFDIAGSVISSPASRPLDLYPVMIENERVRVDTDRLTKRAEFLPAQVVHAKVTDKDK